MENCAIKALFVGLKGSRKSTISATSVSQKWINTFPQEWPCISLGRRLNDNLSLLWKSPFLVSFPDYTRLLLLIQELLKVSGWLICSPSYVTGLLKPSNLLVDTVEGKYCVYCPFWIVAHRFLSEFSAFYEHMWNNWYASMERFHTHTWCAAASPGGGQWLRVIKTNVNLGQLKFCYSVVVCQLWERTKLERRPWQFHSMTSDPPQQQPLAFAL